MNRRTFVGNAIAGLAGSGILTQMRGWAQATTNANGLKMSIGFQSYGSGRISWLLSYETGRTESRVSA